MDSRRDMGWLGNSHSGLWKGHGMVMKLPTWTVEGAGDGYETPNVDCGMGRG